MSKPADHQPQPQPQSKNPLLGVFDLLGQHQKALAELSEAKKAKESAEAALVQVQQTLDLAKAAYDNLNADLQTVGQSLAAALAENADLKASAEKVPGLEQELTEAKAKIGELESKITTVNQGVQAALEQVGFDAAQLPAPVSAETADAKDLKAEALYQKAASAKTLDEKRAILAEAKAEGIDLIKFAEAKEAAAQAR